MRRLRLGSGLSALAIGALAFAACKNTNSVGGGTGGTGGSAGTSSTGGSGGSGGGQTTKVSKVDLLFNIDNSRSMADKQEILNLALDDLITGLTNPPCLDPGGNYVSQPGALATCPEGSAREFEPITDLHIGVISSSIGGHGSDACSTSGAGKQSNDDKAHLLAREDAAGATPIPTYDDTGFLAWDPGQALDPPGEADAAQLTARFRDIVTGVGQVGCGYEAPLESLYRFLSDPAPYDQIVVDSNTAEIVTVDVDNVLLAQRKAFLRPDSMLVIVALSDENDCSIREEGQFYLAAQQKGPGGAAFHLPAPRAVCATDPNNECCYSCGQAGPKDDDGNPLCPSDPSCTDGQGQALYLDEMSDNINLRCFDQKRRFGIDFLYPTDRYVSSLTSPTVTDRAGNVVANPLFSDLDPDDDVTTVRDPGLVIFAGIVGVPWQDIAKNPSDLTQGFKTAGELTQENASGKTTWDIILGDPTAGVPPLDPFMRESIGPRTGENPVVGDAMTVYPEANPINGWEWTIPKQDDLQYACIMPITDPRDCTQMGLAACDCENATNDNPLCEVDPNTGDPTLQTHAKAYPGIRQLSVLKGLGDRAVIGSICATQLTDPTLPDYAYRPAMASLLDRMKPRLQ